MIEEVKVFFCRKQRLRVEYCPVIILLLAAFIASCGFLLGISIQGAYFWFSIGLVSLLVAVGDWRRVVALIGLVFVLLGITAYTFAYTQIDGVHYHTPMQLLLRDGWNPVCDSTMEGLVSMVGGDCDVWPYHVLCLPKFNALCGAIVAKATGLWIGNGFLNYSMMVLVFSVSYRFARSVWRCGGMAGIVFALALAFPRQVSSILTGEVDYIVYAAFVVAVLSGWRLVASPVVETRLLFFSSVAIGVLTKSSAILWGAVMVMTITGFSFRKKNYWGCFILFLLFCLIVGWAPYMTNWLNYGSPLYPNHTFSADVQTVDITSDFTGNADLLSMGFFSRVTYAWVSPEWTVRILRMLRDIPDFNPISTVGQGGVSGLGMGFRVLLLLSVGGLLLSHGWCAVAICVFTFLVSNLVPLKYIGYSRYFPQMWIIPIVAVFNLLYAPRQFLMRLVSHVRKWVLVLIALIMCMVVLRYCFLQFRVMICEGIRQSQICKMRRLAAIWHVPRFRFEQKNAGAWKTFQSHFGYTFRSRIGTGGVKLSYDSSDKFILRDEPPVMPVFPGSDDFSMDKFNADFPVPSKPGDFLDFNWLEAFRMMPQPIFCTKERILP